MRPSGEIIVITGASKGLGRQTALRLCRPNRDLVLVARGRNGLKEIQEEIEGLVGKKPLVIPCDVSREADVGLMAESIGGTFDHVDVLVNNAGIGIHKISEKLSNEEKRRQFEVNFYGPFYCIKALLPLLKRSLSPYILNIGSLTGRVSFAGNSVYGATKSALAGFSGGLLGEMRKWNIRVGLFSPGLMDTTFRHDGEDAVTPRPFMILDPEKAASRLERMIDGRKKGSYMYRWMLLPMKVKQATA